MSGLRALIFDVDGTLAETERDGHRLAFNRAFFEDSQHGGQAGSQLGLKNVVTVNDYTKGQDFADAILLLNHLGEPEQPFTVIAGEVQDVCYFDMAMARRLLG